MAYTREDLRNLNILEEDFKHIPVASLDLFNKIGNIKYSQKAISEIDYTKDIYLEYLSDIQTLDETLKHNLLKNFKNADIFVNHTLEREDYEALRRYNETHNSIAIDYLLRRLVNENRPLTEQLIKKAHEILMRGTSTDLEAFSGIRTSNSHIVGYNDDGKEVIQFLPISHDEIEWALAYLCAYFNCPENADELLTQPVLTHGLVASLQIFKDGNTRFGRTLQYLKLYMLTKKFYDDALNMPALYFSKAYIPYLGQYRNLIADLVKNNDDETWNSWIIFNLRRMQDQIFVNQEALKLERIRR